MADGQKQSLQMAVRVMARRLRDPGFWRATVPTLVAAICAGGIAWWLQIPIPWLIGPILSTLALVSIGQPVNTMGRLRGPMVGIIGAMRGASFTSGIFGQIVSWWPLFLGLFCASVLSSAMAYLILPPAIHFLFGVTITGAGPTSTTGAQMGVLDLVLFLL